MWDEAAIQGLAAQQHGLVERSQLSAMGITSREIAGHTGRERVEALQPGVYYMNATPPTWQADVLAAVMGAGPKALASHRCAAVLWDLAGIRGKVIEVTVPLGDGPEPVGAIVHRTRRHNVGALAQGIPITTIERTLMDLARTLGDRIVLKAMRSAIHQQLTTPAQIDGAIGQLGGRGVGGTRRMRRVLRLAEDDESGSVAEVDLRMIILDAPVPTPVQQMRVRLSSATNAYPDFAWPDRMRIVEVDGFGAHGTPEQVQNDLRRQNLLMELGWEIRRFTATEVRDQPLRVRADLVKFVNRPFRAD